MHECQPTSQTPKRGFKYFGSLWLLQGSDFCFLEILQESVKVPGISNWMKYQTNFSFGDIGGKNANDVMMGRKAAYDSNLVIENASCFSAGSLYREHFAGKESNPRVLHLVFSKHDGVWLFDVGGSLKISTWNEAGQWIRLRVLQGRSHRRNQTGLSHTMLGSWSPYLRGLSLLISYRDWSMLCLDSD